MKAMKKKVMEVPEKLQSIVDVDYCEKRSIFALFPSIEKSPNYSFDLERIVDYSMREQVMKVKEESRAKEQQSTDSMVAASPRPPTTRKASMVGFDGYLIQLLDVLTGQQSTRQIISAFGMGGRGKTTLARNMYDDLLILQHFDIRVWATISQAYDIKEILLEFLSCKGESTRDTIGKLGEQLHKKLSGKRYLIVLDDMWCIKVWDEIKFFFPDNGNRSRIVLTTRISNVSRDLSSSSVVMNLLDEDKIWKLFCATTFEEECHLDLVEIEKMIVEKCRGLPLSIVVIWGILENLQEQRNNGWPLLEIWSHVWILERTNA